MTKRERIFLAFLFVAGVFVTVGACAWAGLPGLITAGPCLAGWAFLACEEPEPKEAVNDASLEAPE